MTARTGDAPKARTGRWIPWTFVGMFGVILAVNGIMVTLAFYTWSGLSTADPYRRGLAHNQTVAEIERQERLGWKVSLGFTPGGPGAGELRLRALNKAGRPILGATVTATVIRPVVQGADFTVTVPGRGKGLYTADVRFPKPGQWEVRYRIHGDGETVTAVGRIRVR